VGSCEKAKWEIIQNGLERIPCIQRRLAGQRCSPSKAKSLFSSGHAPDVLEWRTRYFLVRKCNSLTREVQQWKLLAGLTTAFGVFLFMMTWQVLPSDGIFMPMAVALSPSCLVLPKKIVLAAVFSCIVGDRL